MNEHEYELIVEYEDGEYKCYPYLNNLEAAIEDAKIINNDKECFGEKVKYVCVDECFGDGRENINVWSPEMELD